MPCWSIHLGVCTEVNKKFNLDKDLVLFGSILPDLLDRRYSHYYDGYLPNIESFINKYKDNINNPIIIGYYIHLLTDYYYNEYIYSNCFVYKDKELIGVKLLNGDLISSNDFKYCRRVKQDDFKNYGNYLINSDLIEYPINYNKIYDSIKELDFNIDLDNIKDKVNYFKSDKYFEYNIFNGYKLLDKTNYDKLYNDTINKIISKLYDII